MALPPEPVLRAAVRWLERIPASGARRCRALFTTHADFSDITPTQYDAAYAWLEGVGLLDGVRDGVPVPEQIFAAALRDVVWFPNADFLIQSPDEVPEDALRAAEILGIDSMEAFQHIRSVWGKVDSEQRAQLGAIGEAVLVELLESSVAARVEQVSRYSDGYGYDIDVQGSSGGLHIEVKATLRRHRLILFLSRHEYETMVCDPAWQLVIVRLSEDFKPAAVYSIRNEWLRQHAPRDSGTNGRWEACRFNVPASEAGNGIARLAPLLLEDGSPLLRSRARWQS